MTDADGVVELVNTYDEQGRVLTQRSPFGRLVTFSYGSDGTTVVADDSAGPTNVYRHDRAGRLVAVTDGHGHTLRKRYDAWGNPVEIVERGGGVTRQEFDDRGHLVRRTTPSGARVHARAGTSADRVVAVTRCRRGDPLHLRRRRAHPVRDRRPGGRGHPAARSAAGWCRR